MVRPALDLFELARVVHSQNDDVLAVLDGWGHEHLVVSKQTMYHVNTSANTIKPQRTKDLDFEACRWSVENGTPRLLYPVPCRLPRVLPRNDMTAALADKARSSRSN
jgi:hypothetical protein